MTEEKVEANRSKWGWGIACFVVLGLLLAARVMFGPRSLSVETQPAGATVFVNGRLAGKTPLRINDLARGSYSLRIERENYTPLTFPISLGIGTTQISETLPARGIGTLKIEIGPAGAEVLLDGELAGHTPVELSGVPAGVHELVVRKTNFKSFTQRITVESGATLPYKDIVLEDVILAMLQNAIDKDTQRVSNYMDMGHYLFVNNKIQESAEFYVRGLKVAASPLTFPKDANAEEKYLEQRLRGEDVQRINDDIRKKQGHNGHNVAKKDMELFIRLVNQQQEDNASQNLPDWNWVQAQADNFIKDGKYESAEKLYLRHIEAARGMPSVAQAYIGVVTVRLRMKRVAEAVQASNDLMATNFGRDSALLRQCANTIYTQAGAYVGTERGQLLSQSETMLRRALGAAPKRSEMSALCKFELAYVLEQEEHFEDALPLYRDSVVETNDASTKELRMQREVSALRKLKQTNAARELLMLMAKSPRDYIKRDAEEQLRQIGQ